MVRTKVFVGNLSFKTTDKDLSKEFEVAGKVATANIITRGSRSLGYGFVEMESEEDAKKSVELLNKKTIDGREINVEVARPREDRPAAPAGEGAPAPAAGDAATGSPAARGRGRRGGRRTGGGAAAGGAATGSSAPAGDAAAPTATAPAAKRRAPRKKNSTPGEVKTGVEVGTAGDATTGSPSTAGTRRARAPRRTDPDRPASTTTLFVANLPFTVDDAQLADLFKGFNIKAAHVVRKPNNNAKSKGFGFVEFNSEDDQKKALDAVNKRMVGDRELSVKVALAEVPRPAAGTPAAGEASSSSTVTVTPVSSEAATPAAGLPAVPAPGVAATAESK